MSVLKKPEVSAKYSQHFLGAHADFGDLDLDPDDPRHEMVKRHNPQKLRPVIVFLDSTGKERLAKGVGADQDWKDKIDFYVKGVDGKIPSGK